MSEPGSELRRKIGLLGTRVHDLLDECERLRAVVAAQREALRKIAGNAVANEDPVKVWRAQQYIAQQALALDAEGVSEPGPPEAAGDGWPRPGSGSLTSPVVCQCGHPWGHHPYSGQAIGRKLDSVTDGGCQSCDCPKYEPLTSPVDTAPRGYVEHGPEGPQAVYHAETPDAYLEHGDR